MNYPNLREVYKTHPYHYTTFADFAEVTPELWVEFMKGKEELALDEVRRVSRYSGIPFSVLECPKKIMLDNKRYRHRKMIDDQAAMLEKIKELAVQGYRDAESYMSSWWLSRLKELHNDFLENKASYGAYLGVQEGLDQTISFCCAEDRKRTRRGIKKRDSGEVHTAE